MVLRQSQLVARVTCCSEQSRLVRVTKPKKRVAPTRGAWLPWTCNRLWANNHAEGDRRFGCGMAAACAGVRTKSACGSNPIGLRLINTPPTTALTRAVYVLVAETSVLCSDGEGTGECEERCYKRAGGFNGQQRLQYCGPAPAVYRTLTPLVMPYTMSEPSGVVRGRKSGPPLSPLQVFRSA